MLSFVLLLAATSGWAADPEVPVATDSATGAPAETRAAILTCPEPARPVGATPPLGYELKCTLSDGTAHGVWLTWYESGELMSRHTMRDGEEHGLQESWWPNGAPMMRGISFEGQRYPGFEYWDLQGEPVTLGVEERAVPAEP